MRDKSMRRVGVIWAVLWVISINAIHAMAQAAITDIAWNTDGSQIAIARNDGSLEVVTIDGRTSFLLRVSEHAIVSVAWDPVDPNILAITTTHGNVQILKIDQDQYKILLDLLSQQNYVPQVDWSPDGSKLATIGETGGGATSEYIVKIWDSDTGKLLASYEDGYVFTDIAWDPQNVTQLLITGVADYYGAELLLWDVHTQETIWKVEEPDSGVTYMEWNPTGSHFVTSTTNFQNDLPLIRIHDARTGASMAGLPTEQTYIGSNIAWNTGLYLTISGPSGIEVWHTVEARIIKSIGSTDFGTEIAWSPDGTKIAYGGLDLSGNAPEVQIVDVTDIELTPEATQEAMPTP